MRGLFPPLREVWEIPDSQCKTVGGTWDSYIMSIPEERRSRGLLWIVGAMPLLAALGATSIIFVPRLSFTLGYLRANRQGRREVQGGLDAFAASRSNDVASAQVTAAAASAAAREESLTGSGYDGERNGEYSTIDGTEAVA